MADKRADSGPELGFDQVLDRLREVVDHLEEGHLSLEEALSSYEEGVALARRGHLLLGDAERRVDLLIRGREGALETVAAGDEMGMGEEDGEKS